MADKHEQPKPPRAAPPPFAGPPRGGALSPKTRTDRPTLPPFSPPWVNRATPPLAAPSAGRNVPAQHPVAPAAQDDAQGPRWLTAEPNEAERASARSPDVDDSWFNPEEPVASAPSPAPTGIAWLDSPAPERTADLGHAATPNEDGDDVFGWDPAEEPGTALNTPPTPGSLEALKELEPWAQPGTERASITGDDAADTLQRIAARIRSGDLLVPGVSAATSDEAVLASVLAALLQRARG